jgi:hypothetical protein
MLVISTHRNGGKRYVYLVLDCVLYCNNTWLEKGHHIRSVIIAPLVSRSDVGMHGLTDPDNLSWPNLTSTEGSLSLDVPNLMKEG